MTANIEKKPNVRLRKLTRGGRQANCERLLRGFLEGPVLEIGCADGGLLGRMQDDAPSLQCIGVDVDIEALRRGKLKHPFVKVVAARAEALPFSEQSFRTAVMLDVLEHVSDDGGAIREVGRVLTPNGRLVLTTPHSGLFSWLDVSNLKLQLPGLYRLFLRLTGAHSHSLQHQLRDLDSRLPGGTSLSVVLRVRKRELEHRHYSVQQLRTLLVGFRLETIRRTGLLVFPIMHILGVFVSKVFRKHLSLFTELAALEDGIVFGPASYNIALRAVKDPRLR